MRTTTMSDALHGQLVHRLRDERKHADNSIRIIERNAANDWKGIPPANRRSQEERLQPLRADRDILTTMIDALEAATTH